MTDSPSLSICIPTYNFGEFIGDALASVRQQLVPGIEVIVLDGASTDDTATVVGRHQRDCPEIRYHRQAAKGGIDSDMDQSVRLARGTYCWLLSADDALAANAVERIYAELRRGCDVYLCERILCDRSLTPQRRQRWLHGAPPPSEVRLNDDRALCAYLAAAVSIGALFSYMSAIVVQRESWLRSEPPPIVLGTNYAHVYRLFAMRKFGGTLGYIPESLVLCRTGNDSFLSEGIVRRHYLDLHGFRLIGDELFPDSPRLRRLFREAVNREHHWVTWVWIATIASDEEWAQIRKLLRGYGYSAPTLWAIKLMSRLPNGVINAHRLRNYGNRALDLLRVHRS